MKVLGIILIIFGACLVALGFYINTSPGGGSQPVPAIARFAFLIVGVIIWVVGIELEKGRRIQDERGRREDRANRSEARRRRRGG
jgi:hypothetical protein